MPEYELREPSPESLSESLRSVGYSLATAIADIVDNSVSAGARNVWLHFHWNGERSCISIADDGRGMTESTLSLAMRPGSASPLAERGAQDLGRFGLGLKTASFSQCRSLEVWTKTENGELSGRAWDLDYVVKCNEWRLIIPHKIPDLPEINKLQSRSSGTVVIWDKLDRLVTGTSVNSPGDHERFLRSIDHVRSHLAMIFHRFLDGSAQRNVGKLAIWVNGERQQHAIKPWSPVAIPGAPHPKETPLESIATANGAISLQGFVMPHKDRLTEEQFAAGAGPNGWQAQQGFYIYRADRMIVAGDWLRLGRPRAWGKEEHYKLARLILNIPNCSDDRWSLDIKKSTARPPADLQYRLTDLAEIVRRDARQVFASRGKGIARGSSATPVMIRPWINRSSNGRTRYQINPMHPVVAETLAQLGPLAVKLKPLFRLLEETVPTQQIWLDMSDSSDAIGAPYALEDDDVVLSDLRIACIHLKRTLRNKEAMRVALMAVEPFGSYPQLIDAAIAEVL